jgi:hypothetical protein
MTRECPHCSLDFRFLCTLAREMHLEKCRRENGTFESCPYCALSFSYLCPLAQRMHVKQCGMDEDMIIRSPPSSPESNGQKRMGEATTTTDVLDFLSPEPSHPKRAEGPKRGPASAMAIRMSQHLNIRTSDDEDECQAVKPAMTRSSEKAPKSKKNPPEHRKTCDSDAGRADRASPKRTATTHRVGSAQVGKNTVSEHAPECHQVATETSKSKGTKRKRPEPGTIKQHGTECAPETSSSAPNDAEEMPDYNSMDVDELKRIASGFGLKVGIGFFLFAACFLHVLAV